VLALKLRWECFAYGGMVVLFSGRNCCACSKIRGISVCRATYVVFMNGGGTTCVLHTFFYHPKCYTPLLMARTEIRDSVFW